MALPIWTDIVPLSPAQIAQLDRYLDLLIEWNTKLNLTRITDRADAELRHVADALSLVSRLPVRLAGQPRMSIADVGTGGGVPGVVIAIARPDLDVTLIDSTKKKLDAISDMTRTLGLANVRFIHDRAENISQKFDIVVARAVADLATLVGWCRDLMHENSTLLAMKGPRAADELRDAQPELRRARLRAVIHDAGIAELPGHVIVEIRR